MIMNRIWAMPNSRTFSIKPIKDLLDRYIVPGQVVIDPFANDATYGTITNDLNPRFNTTYHMDALDFLKQIEDDSTDVVLYDSPYSLRQVKECYDGVGITVTSEHTKASWRAKHLDEIQRILKSGGFVSVMVGILME